MHSPDWARSIGASIAIAVLIACSSTPQATRTSATIGPSAGRVDLPGVASLLVSDGSLGSSLNVTVAVAAPPVAVPNTTVSKVVALTPHGTQFQVPVNINIAFPHTDDTSSLQVMRLADDQSATWTQVGGVTYSVDSKTGMSVASFDSVTFSYYVVTSGGTCTPTSLAVACSSTCATCCGTSSCVDVTSDPNNCGGCGIACGPTAFCAAGGTCSPLASTTLCENPTVYLIQGQLPPLSVVAPEQTADGALQSAVASALSAHCAALGKPITIHTVSQAQPGLVDACTNAPLIKSGNTIALVGGGWSERVAQYLNNGYKLTGGTVVPGGAPVVLTYSSSKDQYTFASAGGTQLVSFANGTLSPTNDYFVISIETDPALGALILQVYGVGWEGTPAAVWYLQNRVLPAIEAGTPLFKSYQLIHWVAGPSYSGTKSAQDTWATLAQDLP